MEDPPAGHGCAEAAPSRMPQPADMVACNSVRVAVFGRGGGRFATWPIRVGWVVVQLERYL
jgi:hypothetical protein